MQLGHARRVLAGLNLQLQEAKAQLIADGLSGQLRDANEQLVVSALKAHAAAELAERARMNEVTSAEIRARRELRAKTALAAMNVDLEDRVAKRTRELVTARDDALAAARTKEAFLSNMSHEIRTPMNGMLGAMDLLSKTPLQPVQAHYIEVATASGEALLAILNEALDFAKIGSNMLHLDHTEIDVNAKATLNKSLPARSSLLWAVCGVANPRHSWAMAVVCALQPIPNQGAHTGGDLFSVALTQSRKSVTCVPCPSLTADGSLASRC